MRYDRILPIIMTIVILTVASSMDVCI